MNTVAVKKQIRDALEAMHPSDSQKRAAVARAHQYVNDGEFALVAAECLKERGWFRANFEDDQTAREVESLLRKSGMRDVCSTGTAVTIFYRDVGRWLHGNEWKAPSEENSAE